MACVVITRPGRRLPVFLKVQAQLVTGVTLLVMPRIWYKTKEQAKNPADCQTFACALFAHGNRV
jgi:hypothetical protein